MEEDDEMTGALEEVEALDQPDPVDELDRLDPQPEVMSLSCGIEVRLLPLRTRQMFKMMRIITHGAGQRIATSGLNFSDEPDVFLQKLLAVVVFSIPDAEQETIDFLQSMVEPAGLVDKLPRDLSKAEREGNIALWTDLNKELWNPDPLDTIDLVEAVFRREAADLQALGKKIRRVVELAARTGQLQGATQGSESSAGSSTSSPPSTGGPTSKSSTSRSGGSARSSARSPRAKSAKSATVAV